ncbi:sister chromatid cohesion 1 protein 4 [Perilla frutescens var. hirtella]|nr:sister chromatid cohesion 1 protein 4 [Perilla frutescens var. hirtella]
MFFETLVLKTRDYIHVEERNPCGDITMRPRTRLIESDLLLLTNLSGSPPLAAAVLRTRRLFRRRF